MSGATEPSGTPEFGSTDEGRAGGSIVAPRHSGEDSVAPRPLHADLLRVNGVRWFVHYVVAWTAQAIAVRSRHQRIQLEDRYGLAGTNTVRVNRDVWERWDWSRGGEEWTPSQEWRDALLSEVVDAFPESTGSVLEIGPGGGRWTVALAERSRNLVLVDIAPAVLEHCWRILGSDTRAEYVLTEGRSLRGVPDDTVDFLFSFDCFVHIAPHDLAAYAVEFERVLRPGAVVVLHHPGRRTGRGWRSALTTEQVHGALKSSGFDVLRVLERWGPQGRFGVDAYGDAVTVARKTSTTEGKLDG